jgi:uncharacterized protein
VPFHASTQLLWVRKWKRVQLRGTFDQRRPQMHVGTQKTPADGPIPECHGRSDMLGALAYALGGRWARQTGRMRVEIHVRPSATKTIVGGTHDGALLVRVTEPADNGRATAAALRVLADSLKVPRSSVTLVRGATSRRKLIEIVDAGVEPRMLEKRIESWRKVERTSSP